MTDIQFTEEEQQYLRDEGKLPPVEKPQETAKAEEEKPAAQEQAKEGAQEPAEEAKAEEPGEGEGEEEKAAEEPFKKRTPIDTIRELRAERRELRGRVKEFESFKAKAEQRLRELTDFQVQAQAPDKEMEPEAHAQYMEKVEAEKAKAKEEQEQESQQQAVFREVVEHGHAQEKAYAVQKPDYWTKIAEAKELAIEGRAKQLMALDASEEDAMEQAERDVNEYIWGRAQEAFQRKINFAKMAYDEAVALLSQAQSPAKQDEEKKEPAQEPTKIDASKLKPLAAGKQAARNPKGSGASKELTLEDLVSMTDEEFVKIAGDRKALKKIFGE